VRRRRCRSARGAHSVCPPASGRDRPRAVGAGR
jgi:hypothetical protein